MLLEEVGASHAQAVRGDAEATAWVGCLACGDILEFAWRTDAYGVWAEIGPRPNALIGRSERSGEEQATVRDAVRVAANVHCLFQSPPEAARGRRKIKPPVRWLD